jgi:Bacterial capsule synthesis protein PGA_cap
MVGVGARIVARLGHTRAGRGVVAALLAGTLAGGCGGDDPPADTSQPSGDATAPKPREKLKPKPRRVTVSVSGDLLIHSPVYARALALGGGARYDFGPLLRPLRPFVAGADLAFCHVEVPMGPGPPESYPTFNSPPELADAIAATGWDACSTASNHSLDQGLGGIASTSDALDRADVGHTGAYTSAKAARRPLILRSHGTRIALLAYTTETNGIPLPAPYAVNLVAGPGPILADARRARRAGADAVIVNIHWGPDFASEYLSEVTPSQMALARSLASSEEVTAVVGQGSHVVQPIRRVAGRIVVFGEGNLISSQNAACCAAGAQEGMIALLDLWVAGDRARLERVRYVPVWVSQPDYRVLPVGRALRAGTADAAVLRASYRRTVAVAGSDDHIVPVPSELP